MLICYQSMTAFDGVGTYAATLKRHARDVVDATTEVRFQGISASAYGNLVPGDVFPYPYLKHLVQDEALEACWQAEKAGFDAFVVGSFSEPHLRQCRSAVDIPVLSLPESAFLTACSLAEKFALVTLSPHYARRLSEVVNRHGMQSRIAGIFPFDGGMTEREAANALERPDRILEAFHGAAKRAVEAGADVIIPAEGILNEVIYLNSVREAHGAAVMDAVGVVLLDAEKQVRMKQRLGLGVGRAWSYPRAAPELAEALRRNVGRQT